MQHHIKLAAKRNPMQPCLHLQLLPRLLLSKQASHPILARALAGKSAHTPNAASTMIILLLHVSSAAAQSPGTWEAASVYMSGACAYLQVPIAAFAEQSWSAKGLEANEVHAVSFVTVVS